MQPSLRKHFVKCRIVRDRDGFDDQGETASLYLDHGHETGLLLLIARKDSKLLSSQYHLFSTCIDAINFQYGGQNNIALLKGSFWGTSFSLSYFKKTYLDNTWVHESQELLGVIYEPNLPFWTGFGERSFKVVIPQTSDNYDREFIQKLSPTDNLAQRWLTQRHKDGLACFKNTVKRHDLSTFEDRDKMRVLMCPENFKILRSVENEEGNNVDDLDELEEQLVMQFACIEPNVYTLEFTYPMCALQAFSTALAAIGNRWIV